MGDDPALTALFEREYGPLVRVATVIVYDNGLAQEIVQEAFARAAERWSRISRYDKPGAWVRLVVVRLALRTRDRRAREGATNDLIRRAGADDRPLDLDVLRAVDGLPRRQRAAVALHYLCDLPVDEVARVLGISPGAAKVHLHRARQALATQLSPEPATDTPPAAVLGRRPDPPEAPHAGD